MQIVGVILLLLTIGLIHWIYVNWDGVWPVALIVLLVYVMLKILFKVAEKVKLDQAAKAARIAEETARRQRLKEEQQGIINRCSLLGNDRFASSNYCQNIFVPRSNIWIRRSRISPMVHLPLFGIRSRALQRDSAVSMRTFVRLRQIHPVTSN